MNELQPLIDVGQRLRTAFQETIDSCPGLPRRPYEMAKVLKVDKSMTSRLCLALRSDDSVAMLGMLPGALPLKQFLRAVGTGGGDSRKVEAAHATLDEFEAMVKAEFDDRTGLNAVVGAIVPEMAKRQELAARQAAFRSMETLTGISTDYGTATYIAHPNERDGERMDVLLLSALYGLRRVRPGATIQHLVNDSPHSEPNPTPNPLGNEPDLPLLREFCQPSDMQIVRTRLQNTTRIRLAGTAIGRSSAMDFVIAEFHPRALRRFTDPGRSVGFNSVIGEPTKCSIMDVLIHESLGQEVKFDLHIFDTIPHGSVDATRPDEYPDEFHLTESIENLGREAARLHIAQVPRYLEMVTTVMQRMAWNPAEFRCYRCQIDYPVYGSQIAFVHTCRTASA